MNQLNSSTTNSVEVIHIASRELTEESIVNHVITAKRENTHVIFHLFINGDGSFEVTTGGTIKPASLAYLKRQGVKIILTCLEFTKWSIALQPCVVKNWEQYFLQADHIIFLDELDKKTALKKLKLIRTYKREGKISTLPMSTTLEQLHFSQLLPLKKREANFLCFGMIRPFKGIEKFALPLARVLRYKNSNKKVLVVGSILRSDESSPFLLTDMLHQAYGSNESICRKIDGINASVSLLAVEKCELLLSLYEHELKHLTADINVEFHFDVSERHLTTLFNRCRYALNFNFKGVSPHFTGVTNTLMAHMKNYGLDLYMTPLYFKEGGEFNFLAKALSVNGGYPEEGALSFETILEIGDEIIKDTQSIEVDNIYHEAFQRALARFCEKNPLDIQSICKTLNEIYESSLCSTSS